MFDMNGWILVLKIYKIIIELNVTRILQTKDFFGSINGKTDNWVLNHVMLDFFFFAFWNLVGNMSTCDMMIFLAYV